MDKKVLMNVESVYTAFAFRSGRRSLVAAGSETCPEVFLYDLDRHEKELVGGCPGGVMSFVPVPGIEDIYFSVMGLFPGFVGAEAGIFMHRKDASGWKTEKVFPLPFAHRCDVVRHAGRNYLFAVSVSRFKADPADWSNPSDIYVMPLDPADATPGQATLVESTIFRNHGMLKTGDGEDQTLYVSGAEGIFRMDMGNDGKWTPVRVFSKEVSEFGFIDIDSDGRDELATIEPFHGNTLNIYRKSDDGDWTSVYKGELDFGHGLSCGIAAGKPRIAVGNRRGPLTLDTLTYEGCAAGQGFRREVLENEAGPTQTQFFSHQGKNYILSANQRKNEVAIYW